MARELASLPHGDESSATGSNPDNTLKMSEANTGTTIAGADQCFGPLTIDEMRRLVRDSRARLMNSYAPATSARQPRPSARARPVGSKSCYAGLMTLEMASAPDNDNRQLPGGPQEGDGARARATEEFDESRQGELFRRLRKGARPVDRHGLSDLQSWLLDRRIPLSAVSDATFDQIAACLPPVKARVQVPRARRAYLRARERHPDLNLPSVALPPWRHITTDPAVVPRRLREDLERARHLMKTEREFKGLKKYTANHYISCANCVFAALHQDGMPTDAHFGFEQLIEPRAVARYWELRPKSIATTLAALARIGTDLLGPDHPHVRSLRARVGAVFPDPSLGIERLKQLDEWSKPQGIQKLRALPSTILKDATDERRDLSQRRRLVSVAAAFQLVLDHRWLTPSDLSRMNLETDICCRDGARGIRSRSANRELGTEFESLTDEAITILAEVARLRLQLGRPSPWLFPNRDGAHHSSRRSAMTGFYYVISDYLGFPFKIQWLQDLAACCILSHDPNAIDRVANLLRLRDIRSASRRYRALARSLTVTGTATSR